MARRGIDEIRWSGNYGPSVKASGPRKVGRRSEGKCKLAAAIFQAMAATHYEILGVSQDASLDEIKAAHRKLSLLLHPDKQNKSTQKNKSAESRAKAVKASQSQQQTGSLHDIDDDNDGENTSVSEDNHLNDVPEKLEQLSLGENTVQSSEGDDAIVKGTGQTKNEATNDGNIESSTVAIDPSENKRYTFRQIHSAFEALRDPTKRAAYDEELARKSEKRASKVDKAVPVKLSEMEEILYEEEGGYDDGTGGDDDYKRNDGVDEDNCEVAYCYQCRCGDEIQVPQDEIATEPDGKGSDNVFECLSCCLCIRVEVDMPLDEL